MIYSLAGLVGITGFGHRALQLLADNGAIKAERSSDRKGTGRARLFPRGEVLIGCCLTALSRRHAISDLVRVGRQLRSLLQDEKIRTIFEDIVSSRKEQDDFLVVVWSHDDEPKVRLLQEPELSPYLGGALKGRSHAVTLALHETLRGLRLDDLRRNAEEQLQSRNKRSPKKGE